MPDNPFAQVFPGGAVVEIDEGLYSPSAIFKTCYVFTDRAYLYLQRNTKHTIQVRIRAKVPTMDLEGMVGDFCNELIDQRVRSIVSAETGKIRELIVAQAFAEGNLLQDLQASSADGPQVDDPLNIRDHHEQR